MKNSTTKNPDTASNRSDTRIARLKNGIKIVVTSVLLLAASSAMAEITFLPAVSQVVDVDQWMRFQISSGDQPGEIELRSTGLKSEWIIFPAGPTTHGANETLLQLDQELSLVINLSLGVVEGSSSGQVLMTNEPWGVFRAQVRGNASCLPLNGLDCGQLVLDLELHGALSDQYNPAIVGQLHMQMLGSLIVDSTDFGVWAAMSANATIGGNEGLINSLSGLLGDANLDG
jgi:hypothetical protein